MSDQPSKRKVLFDGPSDDDGDLAAASRGEMTLGDALSRSRAALGVTVADAAAHLRIRETFLDALESGDHAHLPGPAYAMGFVRSYANFLGLDGEESVRIFKAERAGEIPAPALVFLEPVAESRIPRGAVLFISVLMAAAAYGGWYYLLSHEMELTDLVPEVPASLSEGTAPAPSAAKTEAAPEAARPAAEPKVTATPTPVPAPEAAPEPAAPVPVARAPEPTPAAKVEAPPAPAPVAAAPEAAPKPEPEPKPAPVAAAPESEAQPAPAPAPAVVAVPEPEAQPAPVTAPAQTASAPAAIEIRAKADSWVQVRGADGRVVVMRILRKGDSYKVPDEKGLTLMTGNAGAIEIAVDGDLVPPIGPFGAVKRDVSLDVARLKAGTAAPQ